jgi:hypothetical protein
MCELTEDVKYIVEENNGKKSVYIEGVFMQADRPNRNGRRYSSDILAKEVDRYVNEHVNRNRAYGELGHPQGPTINLERVSHMIKSIRQEGSDFIGKAKIMDTPYGNIVSNLIAEGASLGVSSRGMGSIKEGKDGIMEVQNDFFLATAADIVADPSAPDAFVRGIMEGVEWVMDPSTGAFKKSISDSMEIMRNDMKKMSLVQLEEQKFQKFEQFLNMISGKNT